MCDLSVYAECIRPFKVFSVVEAVLDGPVGTCLISIRGRSPTVSIHLRVSRVVASGAHVAHTLVQ